MQRRVAQKHLPVRSPEAPDVGALGMSGAPRTRVLIAGGGGDVAALRDLLNELVSGTARSVALTLPSERMWPLPIYELAVLTAAHLREHGSGAGVWLVTPEEEPLGLFGPVASAAIEQIL